MELPDGPVPLVADDDSGNEGDGSAVEGAGPDSDFSDGYTPKHRPQRPDEGGGRASREARPSQRSDADEPIGSWIGGPKVLSKEEAAGVELD